MWSYSPGPEIKAITTRGINYWESKDRTDRRLFFAANHMLRAIDARSGQPILSFGKAGSVDLKEGLGRDPKTIALVQSMTPGRVFEDLLIMGSATNQGYGSAPGDIRFGIRRAHRQKSYGAFTPFRIRASSDGRHLAGGRVAESGRCQYLVRAVHR